MFPSLTVENFRRERIETDYGPHDCPRETYVVRPDGKWMSLPCRGRKCPYCGARFWKKYVQRRMMSGLAGVDCKYVKVLCVTAPSDAPALYWNTHAREHFTALMNELRRLFPADRLEYWKVGELQTLTRHHIHYHIVVRPLKYLSKKVLEALCVKCGFGKVCYIQAVWEHKGGIRGLLGYLGKYLLKEVDAWESEWGHVTTHSHRWSLDWKPKRQQLPGGWRWFSDELSVFCELKARIAEAVSGGNSTEPNLKVALWPPLTAGLSPPATLG